ncbi:MAG: Isocitrate dehydrogenase [NADP] [Chlamydiia bacterium]|nr:Isocitrate dehydrogenase [NADP] [Chlamydiia bacterium]MCH9614931.1 Isocitrate dehydrogenase [NADP] [Chlamydiia bacterium]MCH9629878.1 Isocitrate dehydrogenase [NADP] [Chlamydiia bacterium]
MKIPITVARGDGIGPEIMDATLRILEAAGAELEIHEIEIGEKVYTSGHPTGMAPETWDTIKNTKAFLKAPITTPQGGGFKSLNVTVRTTLGLYANLRPCVSYHPFVKTKHPIMDVVIVRENEEDLYSGIEYRQTPNVCESIKLISRPGSEKICRYAFEYAKRNNRKKVTCFAKDNIMKFSDGLFHEVFDVVAKDYPEIENEFWIVDIGAAKLADSPEAFDVVVMPNLYGDILSDVAAQISGSVGLAGSANIGTHGAMFEAIHGSAPRRAGQNMANPSGLLLGSILMLQHIGQNAVATTVHNAWLKTLEDGIHTYDLFVEGTSKEKVGTKEFADAVIARLGQKPGTLHAVDYQSTEDEVHIEPTLTENPKRELFGVDVYTYDKGFNDSMKDVQVGPFKMVFASNRGAKVYPEGQKETFCIEQWRYRFIASAPCTQENIAELLAHLAPKVDMIKTENLFHFDGKPGYTSSQDHAS